MIQQRTKITLDTNCVIYIFDKSHKSAKSIEALECLLEYYRSGKIEVAVTTRVEAEICRDSCDQRRSEMLHVIQQLPVIGTAFAFDLSKTDGPDVAWARTLAADLQALLFPGTKPEHKRHGNKIRDVHHLVGHIRGKRNVFVTDDKGILGKSEALKRVFEVVVLTPADCLAHIQTKETRPARN